MDMPEDEISDELDPYLPRDRKRHAWTDEEKVEFYLSCAWSFGRIKRETGMADSVLKEIAERVEAKKIREVAEGDEATRAWHIDYLRECAAEAKNAYHAKLNDKNKRDMRYLKAGREFLKDIRAIRGLDAPKNVNHHLDDKPLVPPGDQQAFVNADPETRARLMKLNEERRAIMAQAFRPAGGANG